MIPKTLSLVSFFFSSLLVLLFVADHQRTNALKSVVIVDEEGKESKTVSRSQPFGTLLGNNQRVNAYSNLDEDFVSNDSNYQNGIFTGMQWQCVEYARRWLINIKNITFPSIPTAHDVFDLPQFLDVYSKAGVPLKKHYEGSAIPPQAGMVMIWPRTPTDSTGHIAIITYVSPDVSYFHVAEQNVLNDYWPADYARKLFLKKVDGGFFCGRTDGQGMDRLPRKV
eukprot:TRINITY_DN493_c0_g1_i18.p1 TRINITY_DN493_c0_g1~~TRINITY_DN493_c0_g1_i18.p1  ORF type:complete len:224 (+),score=21.72 TRINITY_DN493_c0_g1_i18:43-714(+)